MEPNGREPRLSDGIVKLTGAEPCLSFVDRIRLDQLTQDERDSLEEGARVLSSKYFVTHHSIMGYAYYRKRIDRRRHLIGFNKYQAIAYLEDIDLDYPFYKNELVKTICFPRQDIISFKMTIHSRFPDELNKLASLQYRAIHWWLQEKGIELLPTTRLHCCGWPPSSLAFPIIPQLSAPVEPPYTTPALDREIINLDYIGWGADGKRYKMRIGFSARINTLVYSDVRRDELHA